MLDAFIQNLSQSMLIPDESHSLEPLVYSLNCWILDYPAAGNGYGFPFDRTYLEFYLRLQEAMEQVEKYLSLFPYDSKQTKILWQLRKCMFEVTSNKNLRLVVKHYQTKVEVFERLRHALRAAPQESRQGLSDLGTCGSMKKTLKSMHPSTPLVMNLKNENYIRLIFGDEHKIAQKFAQVDVLKVREDIHNKTAKKFSISKKSKKMLRDKNFLEKLNVVFEKQSVCAQVS